MGRGWRALGGVCRSALCSPPALKTLKTLEQQMVEVFMPQYLPMLIPPVPWLRNNMGGHLTLRNTGAGGGAGGWCEHASLVALTHHPMPPTHPRLSFAP